MERERQDRPILFEHIPKTGGITLRGIFSKLYDEDQIFFIHSREIKKSLDTFTGFTPVQRDNIKIIAGHSAYMYEQFLDKPFKITILREPLSLFFSQYQYLKISKKDAFWKDVSKLNSPEAYLNYAVEMGQDNLMTRFLSKSMDWTLHPEMKFQMMDSQGDEMLSVAKQNLHDFTVIFSLDNFDAGVFLLNKMLKWPLGIPFYKPSNRTPSRKKSETYPEKFIEKLRYSLRFDIQLYDYFLNNRLDKTLRVDKTSMPYRLFQVRQQAIKYAAIILKKN